MWLADRIFASKQLNGVLTEVAREYVYLPIFRGGKKKTSPKLPAQLTEQRRCINAKLSSSLLEYSALYIWTLMVTGFVIYGT